MSWNIIGSPSVLCTIHSLKLPLSQYSDQFSLQINSLCPECVRENTTYPGYSSPGIAAHCNVRLVNRINPRDAYEHFINDTVNSLIREVETEQLKQ